LLPPWGHRDTKGLHGSSIRGISRFRCRQDLLREQRGRDRSMQHCLCLCLWSCLAPHRVLMVPNMIWLTLGDSKRRTSKSGVTTRMRKTRIGMKKKKRRMQQVGPGQILWMGCGIRSQNQTMRPLPANLPMVGSGAPVAAKVQMKMKMISQGKLQLPELLVLIKRVWCCRRSGEMRQRGMRHSLKTKAGQRGRCRQLPWPWLGLGLGHVWMALGGCLGDISRLCYRRILGWCDYCRCRRSRVRVRLRIGARGQARDRR